MIIMIILIGKPYAYLYLEYNNRNNDNSINNNYNDIINDNNHINTRRTLCLLLLKV